MIAASVMKGLKVRPDEHIGMSVLAFKKTKPSKESLIRDYLKVDNNVMITLFLMSLPS